MTKKILVVTIWLADMLLANYVLSTSYIAKNLPFVARSNVEEVVLFDAMKPMTRNL